MTELGVHRVLFAALSAAVVACSLLVSRAREAAEDRARTAEERCAETWSLEAQELRAAHQRLAARLEAVLIATSRRPEVAR